MPFKKGQSGNPEGRRKKTESEREIETLARAHGPSAIKRLVHWMDQDDPKASVAACKVVLDRGYGMPKQNVKTTIDDKRLVAPAEKQPAADRWLEKHAPDGARVN